MTLVEEILAIATVAELLFVAVELGMTHPTAHAHLAVEELTRGRFARFFWPGVDLVAVGVASPWIGAVASPFALRPCGPALLRALVRPGRPVGPDRLGALLRNHQPPPDLDALGRRVSADRASTEARGETFYPGASRSLLAAFPPRERWDDWVELDSRSWPARVERHSMLVPTTCFNCESTCGLLAYVDRDTLQVRKFEGNPEHPGSRGRNCAKGPATINQLTDPDRILYPLRQAGARGGGSGAVGAGVM